MDNFAIISETYVDDGKIIANTSLILSVQKNLADFKTLCLIIYRQALSCVKHVPAEHHG